MAKELPCASMIQEGSGDGQFWVVYDRRRARPDDVMPLVRLLNRTEGVRAGFTEAMRPGDPWEVAIAMLEGRDRSLIVAVDSSGLARGRAVALVKKLARPMYPIAIRYLQVTLIMCGCGRLSAIVLNRMVFVDGFSPEDEEAFVLRCRAGLQRLQRSSGPLRAQARPFDILLEEAMQKMLQALGAWTTETRVRSRKDSGRCPHQR